MIPYLLVGFLNHRSGMLVGEVKPFHTVGVSRGRDGFQNELRHQQHVIWVKGTEVLVYVIVVDEVGLILDSLHQVGAVLQDTV